VLSCRFVVKHVAFAYAWAVRGMRDRHGVERGTCNKCAASNSECCEFTFATCQDDDDAELPPFNPSLYREEPLSEGIRGRLRKAANGELDLLDAGDRCEGCDCPADAHEARATTEAEGRCLEMARPFFAPLTLSLGIRQSVQDTQSLGMGREGFTYGEVGELSLLRMLDIAQRLHVNGGSRGLFFDLGCGVGKAIILAALHSIGFSRCIGVELLPGLFALADDLGNRFRAACATNDMRASEIADVAFVEGDLMNVDLNGAALVLVNAGSWQEPALSRLRQHLIDNMPDRCILATIRRPVALQDSQGLVALEEVHLPMSWGLAPVYFAERRRQSVSLADSVDLNAMD